MKTSTNPIINRVLLIFLLDTSGSMAGSRIQSLNQSLSKFSDELRKDETISRYLDIAVIAFGSQVLVLPSESAENFHPPELVADGGTQLGLAASVALDLAQTWKDTHKRRGEKFSKPLIILVTDGEPSDDWQHTAARVRQQENKNELTFMSFGVGDEVNLDVLTKFSSKEPAYKLTEVGFGELFKWTSKSVAALANAQVGERGKILSPSNWVEPQYQNTYRTLSKSEVSFTDETEANMVEASPTVKFTLLPSQYRLLTADYLLEKVAPYLQAIERIQALTDEIRKVKHSEIHIAKLSQNSPIGVSLEGVSDTVQLIAEYVIPWKRKHAEKMAEYARREKQYEIERKRIEIQEVNLQLEKSKHDIDKSSIEIEKMRFETEKLRLDNEKARLELADTKVNLASHILTKVGPNLSENERVSYLLRLLPMIDTLVSSDFEILKIKSS